MQSGGHALRNACTCWDGMSSTPRCLLWLVPIQDLLQGAARRTCAPVGAAGAPLREPGRARRHFWMEDLQNQAISLHHEQRARHTVPSYGQALALAQLMESMHMEARGTPLLGTGSLICLTWADHCQ